MIGAALKMILGLGGILLALFLLLKLLQRFRNDRQGPGEGIRLLTTKALAPRKFISLVDVGGSILILGIAESQVSLLDKITDPAQAESLRGQLGFRTETISPAAVAPFGRRGLRPRRGHEK